jgi:hypothetical protein
MNITCSKINAFPVPDIDLAIAINAEFDYLRSVQRGEGDERAKRDAMAMATAGVLFLRSLVGSVGAVNLVSDLVKTAA